LKNPATSRSQTPHGFALLPKFIFIKIDFGREKKMVFYHVSPTALVEGTLLRSLREDGRVYLATSVEQVLYWGWLLFGKSSRRNANLEDCSIYEVEVLPPAVVEDCRGHYAAEYPGVTCFADEVTPHEDLDGEVATACPVIVRRRLEIGGGKWQAWGESHDRWVLEQLLKEPVTSPLKGQGIEPVVGAC
jgi:hypothetical protein